MAQGNVQWVQRLQEIFGAVLSNDRNFKKIMFFIGEKNSGKSRLLILLKLLVGQQFVSSLSMNQLGERFGTSGLYRKRLNMCGECSELNYRHIELLKSLCGEDLINIEFKGKDHFSYENEAILLFSANKSISIAGGSADPAFIDRMLVLKFKHSIPKEKQDKQLIDKLIPELGAIAVWAIEGYKRLLENNYIFTEVEDDDVENYLEDTNTNLSKFFSECSIADAEAKTSTVSIMQAYRQYCKFNNISPLSESTIHEYLQKELDLKSTRFQINGVQTRGYIGIRIIE